MRSPGISSNAGRFQHADLPRMPVNSKQINFFNREAAGVRGRQQFPAASYAPVRAFQLRFAPLHVPLAPLVVPLPLTHGNHSVNCTK
jgi:hypothetical protein